MKKGWKIFWLTCGITLVVGIALLGIGLGLSALAINGLTDYVMFNTELSMLVWLFSGIVVSIYKN